MGNRDQVFSVDRPVLDFSEREQKGIMSGLTPHPWTSSLLLAQPSQWDADEFTRHFQ